MASFNVYVAENRHKTILVNDPAVTTPQQAIEVALGGGGTVQADTIANFNVTANPAAPTNG